MKLRIKTLVSVLALVLVAGCSSKQKDIQDIDTELKNKQAMGSETVGKNKDGNYVVQKKESLATYLLDLQREVYGLEEGIYGNKTYGNKGKYGVLEDCRIEARAKSNGKWEMVDPAPKTILSKEEAKITKKMGVDEKGDLVLLTEEELSNRIKRFERYKKSYEAQDDWYDTEVKACKVSLNNFVNHKFDTPPKTEKFPDFTKVQKSDMDAYICQYVDANASLKTLVKEAVANGWLLQDDLAERAFINDETAKDATNFRHSYVLRIGDWVLSYDYRVNYGDVMNTEKDAELKAWLNRSPDNIADKATCLANGKRWSTVRK